MVMDAGKNAVPALEVKELFGTLETVIKDTYHLEDFVLRKKALVKQVASDSVRSRILIWTILSEDPPKTAPQQVKDSIDALVQNPEWLVKFINIPVGYFQDSVNEYKALLQRNKLVPPEASYMGEFVLNKLKQEFGMDYKAGLVRKWFSSNHKGPVPFAAKRIMDGLVRTKDMSLATLSYIDESLVKKAMKHKGITSMNSLHHLVAEEAGVPWTTAKSQLGKGNYVDNRIRDTLKAWAEGPSYSK